MISASHSACCVPWIATVVPFMAHVAWHMGSTPATPNFEVLGNSITRLRRRRRWTQTELADRAGVSLRTITRIERHDDSHLVSAETWNGIAQAFQLPPIRTRQHPLLALETALARALERPDMPSPSDRTPPTVDAIAADLEEVMTLITALTSRLEGLREAYQACLPLLQAAQKQAAQIDHLRTMLQRATELLNNRPEKHE